MAALAAADKSIGDVVDVGDEDTDDEDLAVGLSPAIKLSKSRKNLFAQIFTSSVVPILDDDDDNDVDGGGALPPNGLSGGGGKAFSLVKRRFVCSSIELVGELFTSDVFLLAICCDDCCLSFCLLAVFSTWPDQVDFCHESFC